MQVRRALRCFACLFWLEGAWGFFKHMATFWFLFLETIWGKKGLMKELKSTNELPFCWVFLSHLPSNHACQNPMLYRGICSILSRPKKETFQTLTTAEEIYSSMSLMWFFFPMSAAPQLPLEGKVPFSPLPSSSPMLPIQAPSKSCPPPTAHLTAFYHMTEELRKIYLFVYEP